MAHDVFISYSSKDKYIANAVCAVLEKHRIRCWIAPRDTSPGDFADAIIKAISAAKVMVVIFSAHANVSENVKSEVAQGVSKGLIIIPFRIQNVMPSGTLDYYLGTKHWLDAFTPPVEQHIERLVGLVQRNLTGLEPSPPPPPPKRKWYPWIVGCLLLLMTMIVPLVLFLSKDGPPTAPAPSPTSTPQSIQPTKLFSGDFFYYGVEVMGTAPQTPLWSQVIPPEDIKETPFVLSGYAGDRDVTSTDLEWAINCHSEPTCLKFVYYLKDEQSKGWAGRLWVDVLYPKYSAGVSLSEVEKLTFLARGEIGGEKVEFRVGSTVGNSPQPSFTTHVVTLSDKWQSYTIDFADRSNLDYVFCGFCWLTTLKLNPDGCTFYLDDIQFE